MANTMPDLITAMRLTLLDSTTPYLWPDDVLSQALADAVTEHSYLFPRLVYTLYDVSANQQDFTLGTAGPTSGAGPTYANPPPIPETDLIAVVGVELPAGTPLPQDPWQSMDPPPAASSRHPQGFRWRWGSLRLRKPATGVEVGASHLVVNIAQTWIMPDNSNSWNGPPSDVPLLILLAKRYAYQLLAEWQVREQGLTTPTITTGLANAHIDVPPILAALEVQITRALALRAARDQTFPILPRSA